MDIKAHKKSKDLRFIDVLGLKLYTGEVDELPSPSDEKILINTMNPRSFTLSRKHLLLKECFENTEILVMDGQYFSLAPLFLKFKRVKKLSGTQAMFHYLAEANKKHFKVFFMGASDCALKKIEERLSIEYPNILVSTYSPPFKEEFEEHENNAIIAAINDFKPDILFVGMTAPKQELWSYLNKNKLDAKIICTIGAAFDWFAKERRQPEKFWVSLGLEWFIRTIRRPEILNRYPDYLMFFWYLFLNVLRIRKD